MPPTAKQLRFSGFGQACRRRMCYDSSRDAESYHIRPGSHDGAVVPWAAAVLASVKGCHGTSIRMSLLFAAFRPGRESRWSELLSHLPAAVPRAMLPQGAGLDPRRGGRPDGAMVSLAIGWCRRTPDASQRECRNCASLFPPTSRCRKAVQKLSAMRKTCTDPGPLKNRWRGVNACDCGKWSSWSWNGHGIRFAAPKDFGKRPGILRVVIQNFDHRLESRI